jgi:hypothetical protein
MPPTNSVNNVLRVRSEVPIELVAELCGLGCGESIHAVENVVAYIRAR